MSFMLKKDSYYPENNTKKCVCRYVCLPLHIWSTHEVLCFPFSQLSPGPASQSPKKPKDPLAELDLKDFL